MATDTAISMDDFENQQWLPPSADNTMIVQIGSSGSVNDWSMIAYTGADLIAGEDDESIDLNDWVFDVVPDRHGYYVAEGITLDHEDAVLEVANWRLATTEDFLTYGVHQPMIEELDVALQSHYENIRCGIWKGEDLYLWGDPASHGHYTVTAPGEYVLEFDMQDGKWQMGVEVSAPTFADFLEAADKLMSEHFKVNWYSTLCGGMYQHYKGDIYVIAGIGIDTEMNVPQYRYYRQGEPWKECHRYAHMWFQMVDVETGSGYQSVPRFTLLT